MLNDKKIDNEDFFNEILNDDKMLIDSDSEMQNNEESDKIIGKALNIEEIPSI
ncbi:11353_t:CDS:1, partial [Gigaspora margarita]